MQKMRGLAFWLQPPGRRIEVKATDTFIVSYPRSGNTWVRFLLTALLRPGLIPDGQHVQETVPDIYTANRRVLARMPSPRLLKSHEYFDPRYPKVLYLVRDPRDVAVSYFDFLSAAGSLPPKLSLDQYASMFVSVGANRQWGTWTQHVESWLATRATIAPFLLVRYEDLHAAPERETERIAEFLGLGQTRKQVSAAIEAASFENMRRVRLGGGIGAVRSHSVIARRGLVGAWREELSGSAAEMIEQAFGRTMSSLGYLSG